ncbi:helix-turn-helix transcriptional regulator [uncultured Nocardioides sp.]|uniref:helix-turn-helix domain-containing protein n=1 Tax=uncultured Nocardioides sp. TaxID=198441 RepID=UPI0034559771
MPHAAGKPPLSAATGKFGDRIRERRYELDLSQEDLAERTALHWSYIGQVERGQNNLTLHNILRLAHVLEVDPGELIRGLEAPQYEVPPPGSVAEARRAKRRRLREKRLQAEDGQTP